MTPKVAWFERSFRDLSFDRRARSTLGTRALGTRACFSRNSSFEKSNVSVASFLAFTRIGDCCSGYYTKRRLKRAKYIDKISAIWMMFPPQNSLRAAAPGVQLRGADSRQKKAPPSSGALRASGAFFLSFVTLAGRD